MAHEVTPEERRYLLEALNEAIRSSWTPRGNDRRKLFQTWEPERRKTERRTGD